LAHLSISSFFYLPPGIKAMFIRLPDVAAGPHPPLSKQTSKPSPLLSQKAALGNKKLDIRQEFLKV
jgi:hypothetical protein